MNPLTSLYRRSRVFRFFCYLLCFPLWVFVWFVSTDVFAKYTNVGDISFLVLLTLFALWAWWYSEDRDRRRAAAGNGATLHAADGTPTAPSDGAVKPLADGDGQ
jgi:hypothetical protein